MNKKIISYLLFLKLIDQPVIFSMSANPKPHNTNPGIPFFIFIFPKPLPELCKIIFGKFSN